MNLANAMRLYAYGTSEGAVKAWDTRGRGTKVEPGLGSFTPRTSVEDKFVAINRAYREFEVSGDLDDETYMDARDATIGLLNLLRSENLGYLHRPGQQGRAARGRQEEYRRLIDQLRSGPKSMTTLDQAVNVMHIDYDGKFHWLEENRDRLSKEGMSEEAIDDRSQFLEQMLERFNLRRGAVPK